MYKVKLITKIPLRVLQWIFWTVVHLFPRSKKVWVFDSWRGRRFADNSKYLFLYVAKEKQDKVCPVWITSSIKIAKELRQEGYKAYTAYSVRGIWYSLRAKVYITDTSPLAVPFWFMGGAKLFNLWHGTFCFKKIVYDSIKTKQDNVVYSSHGIKRLFWRFMSPDKFYHGDYIFMATKNWAAVHASAFKKDSEHILIAQPPRLDVILHNVDGSDLGMDDEVKEGVEELNAQSKLTCLYMPTFRDGANQPFELSTIEASKFNEVLSANNVHIYVKMHHEDKIDNLGSNIHSILTDSDVYPLLPLFDVLITDYSSIYFDFLLLDKPVIFFAYDLQDYLSNKREMYFSYEDALAGNLVSTYEDLGNALVSLAKGEDEFKQKRTEIKKQFFSDGILQDGSRETYNKILEKLTT